MSEDTARAESGHPNQHQQFETVRQAIVAIACADQAPSLQQLADQAGLSPFHFQRSFVGLAGVTPKEFSQALTLGRAKQCLQQSESVLSASLAAGLSGPSRLHDLFLSLSGLTPGEFKRQGQGLRLAWTLFDTVLGRVWLAASTRGVLRMAFVHEQTPEQLQHEAGLPQALWQRDDDGLTSLAAEVQRRLAGLQPQQPISLVLSGTPLRLKVWEALLRIPAGQLLSYGQLARLSGAPQAVRAVASCVAANPIAYLIPCHRVIRANAEFGEYRWGPATKRALLGLELARAG